MKLFHIAEKSDSEGRVYFKALGFLDGKSYRGKGAVPRSQALALMTRNPNAKHPGDWPKVNTTVAQLDAFESPVRYIGPDVD